MKAQTAPYTVTREAFTPGALDAHGNPVDAWAAGVSVSAIAWAPAGADKAPVVVDGHPVITDMDLYLPPSTTNAHRDKWTLTGTEYQQVGRGEDYTHGPFEWEAGIRVNLKLATGGA